jgi:hypothetical protein
LSLSPGKVDATVTSDASGWHVTSSQSTSGDVFLSGLAVPLTDRLPGGVKNVTWSADFTADVAGVRVNWEWEAAAYRQLAGTDVKPTDARTLAYHNSDSAGTPEANKRFLVSGGTGHGGDDWTGNPAGHAVVTPEVPPVQVQAQASLSGFAYSSDGTTQTPEVGVQVTLTGTNSQNQPVSITMTTDSTGAFSFTGLQAGTYTISMTPPAAPAGDMYSNTQITTGQINGQGGGTTTYATTSPSITLGSTDVGTAFTIVNNYSPLG